MEWRVDGMIAVKLLLQHMDMSTLGITPRHIAGAPGGRQGLGIGAMVLALNCGATLLSNQQALALGSRIMPTGTARIGSIFPPQSGSRTAVEAHGQSRPKMTPSAALLSGWSDGPKFS